MNKFIEHIRQKNFAQNIFVRIRIPTFWKVGSGQKSCGYATNDAEPRIYDKGNLCGSGFDSYILLI
jgi:hypothetical protein